MLLASTAAMFIYVSLSAIADEADNSPTKSDGVPRPGVKIAHSNRPHGEIQLLIGKNRYLANELVSEPIVYTLQNSTDRTVYYTAYPDGPITFCRAGVATCDPEPHPYASMFPEAELLSAPRSYPLDVKVKGVWQPRGAARMPHEPIRYRLVFEYWDEPQEQQVRQGRRIKAIYSRPFEVTSLPTTKQTTIELCQRYWNTTSLPVQNPCPGLVEREFGDLDHPLSLSKLLHHPEGSLGEPVAIRALVKLTTLYATAQSLPEEAGRYPPSPLFLHEQGRFVYCKDIASPRHHCQGWKDEQRYLLHGYLRKGNSDPLDARSAERYYFEVLSKEELSKTSQ